MTVKKINVKSVNILPTQGNNVQFSFLENEKNGFSFILPRPSVNALFEHVKESIGDSVRVRGLDFLAEKPTVIVQTLPRSGTHFLLRFLGESYRARIFQLYPDGLLEHYTKEFLERGVKGDVNDNFNTLNDDEVDFNIVFCHAHHPVGNLISHIGVPATVISCVCYPFDYLFATGIALENNISVPTPTNKQKGVEDYKVAPNTPRLKSFLNSEQFEFQRLWANALAPQFHILRYEDIITDESHLNTFFSKVLGDPIKSVKSDAKESSRLYWKGNYSEKYTREGFEFVKEKFAPLLANFYPEIEPDFD